MATSVISSTSFPLPPKNYKGGCCGFMRCKKYPNVPPKIHPPFFKPPTPSTEPEFSLPLTGIHISSRIVDFTSEVEVLQRYSNNEEDPIEATYEFPLQSNASVTNFWAQIDEDKIIGQLKEKNEAKDTYDDAISSGHGAYLMEQSEEKEDLFKVSIGNLPPGKEIIIGITYVMELRFDKSKLKFTIPWDSNNIPNFQKSKNDTFKKMVDFGLKLKIDLLFSQSNIKTVESPSHPIEFEFGDSLKEASVSLKIDPNEQLKKDFDLQITLKNPHETTALIEKSKKNPNSKSALFCIYPELDEDKDDINAEIIFLVDRSGSMSSEGRIAAVRETLQVFLTSLPESVFFNIHGFGTRFENLFPESQPFNDETLQKAQAHAKKLNANLGGTDILTPLTKIFNTKLKEGTPRLIFLLTDGQVGNTNLIIETVRKNSKSAKVFTFGMGSGADKKLVEGVGKAGNGLFSFIKQGDNVDSIVLKSLEKALKPSLTELKFECSDKSLNFSPTYLVPQIAGESILLYTFLEKDLKSVQITLSGKCGKKSFVFKGEAKFNEGKEGDLIHSLAARSFIKDFENSRSYFHEIDGKLKFGKSQSQVDSEMLKLSLKNHILCKSTAFVAVEKRKEATEGTMQERKITFDSQIPQQSLQTRDLPKFAVSSSIQKSGLPKMLYYAKKKESNDKSKLSPMRKAAPLKEEKKKSKQKNNSMSKEAESVPFNKPDLMIKSEKCASDSFDFSPSLPSAPVSSSSIPISSSSFDSNQLRTLLKLTNANGSFKPEALPLIKKSITNQEIKDLGQNEDAVRTAIIILFLENECQDQKTTWNLLVKKARKFVSSQSPDVDLFNLVKEKFKIFDH